MKLLFVLVLCAFTATADFHVVKTITVSRLGRLEILTKEGAERRIEPGKDSVIIYSLIPDQPSLTFVWMYFWRIPVDGTSIQRTDPIFEGLCLREHESTCAKFGHELSQQPNWVSCERCLGSASVKKNQRSVTTVRIGRVNDAGKENCDFVLVGREMVLIPSSCRTEWYYDQLW